LAGERLRKVLFGEHPYAKISPSEAQVAAYKKEELQTIYRDSYTPENAMLLLVGDFEPKAMLGTIEKSLRRGPEKANGAAGCRSRKSARTPRVSRACSRRRADANSLRLPFITRKNPDWISSV